MPKPVICYPEDCLPKIDISFYEQAQKDSIFDHEVIIPPRDARCFSVKQGQIFRITSIEGAQVGDLNLFHENNLNEKFYSGKTRALHGTHVSKHDQLWSGFPYMRPMATIIHDSLGDYGFDEDGASVHDVIGTRCDPYTAKLLWNVDYHHCCHSNLTRALANYLDMPTQEAEPFIHDVLNVFMCTGFEYNTGRYFMKKSPVKPGDYIEFFANIDLLGVLSTCPGGDCGQSHSSDEVPCHPLCVEVRSLPPSLLASWQPPIPSPYQLI